MRFFLEKFAEFADLCVRGKTFFRGKWSARRHYVVHWTLGILRHFRVFFWLRVFSAPNRIQSRSSASNANR